MTNEEMKERKAFHLDTIRIAMNADLEKVVESRWVRVQWDWEKARERLGMLDERIGIYIRGILEEPEVHNVYEVAGVAKFLRLLASYAIDVKRARDFIDFYESIEFTGMDGARRYRMTPVQAFQFTSIFLFLRSDGLRLVRDVILFVPRKFGKTTSVAALAVYELLFGAYNAEAYIAANSEQQSGICFNEAKNIIGQIDKGGRHFRTTMSEISYKPHSRLKKRSKLCRLTAGGRTKDGANASLFVYDEYAAARYIKDRSEGAELYNVMTSSMGTRLEHLTVVITTASRVTSGPFEVMLNSAKEDLLEDSFEMDSLFASIFCPEPWMTHEDYGKETTWRMCNPHIGVTIQDGYYADEWKMAQRDPEKMREYLCKYLNVFLSSAVKDWIPADDIRRRQVGSGLDYLTGETDCSGIMGLDFSRGDDFNCAVTMICFESWQRDPESGLEYRYLFDVDAWISSKTLEEHQNRRLYQRWVDQGWLRVSPGSVVDERLVVDRTADICTRVPIARIGYDPYDSSRYVVGLTELCISMGASPKKVIKPVSQTWGSFNASTQAFRHLLYMDGSPIAFSRNPIFPFCFGNCYLEEDRYECVKPVKKTAAAKIDAAICALMCVRLLDDIGMKGV